MPNSSHQSLTAPVPVEFDPFAEGEVQLIAPSTESQKEIWASVQIGTDANCAYNESMSLQIKGKFEVDIFRSAINDLIQCHDAFRTTFSTDGSILSIAAELAINVPFIDLSGEEEAERTQKLDDLLVQAVTEPFSLEHGPLLRASVIKLGNEVFRVILTAHHIICDGWAMAIAIRDLSRFYRSRQKGIPPTISPDYRFSDYAIEDNEFLQSENGIATEQFWLKQFSGDIPLLDLPTDNPRPAVRTFEAKRIDHRLPAKLVEGLKSLGAQTGCTFITVLLASFYTYLYRISGQDDLSIGMPSAGQSATGKETLVGHCVNLLPLRSKVNKQHSFREYLKEVRSMMFDAYEYQRYTFVSLIKKIQLLRDPSRVPLVPVIFNLDQQTNEDGFKVEGLEADIFSNPRKYENFEIFFNITSTSNNKVVFECTFNANLFTEDTVHLRLTEFETFLHSVVTEPDRLIAQLPLLPAEEQQKLFVEWNATSMDYPRHLCIHQLFENQVLKNPEKTALVFENSDLTYQDLNKQANRLAHHIRKSGIQPGSAIGLFLPRSLDMVVSMLAVLKAGCAYVPLDPDYPALRLSYMVENSAMPVIITQQSLQKNLPESNAAIICLDSQSGQIDGQDSNPDCLTSPDSLAYIIYTSGSTGKPKGVQVPHRGVVNLVTTMAREPGITETDTLLAVITLSFDMSVPELILPLTVGAKVVIAGRETTNNGELLAELLHNSRATILQATPATFHMMIESGWQGSPNLRIICGGEALPKSLAAELLKRSAQLWNMYGPTEITVYATCYRIADPGHPILIGHPIGNVIVYILDGDRQPVPIGVPGELYVGGDGVTRGYLNRDDLTAKQFISNPFSGNRNDILYRTGDLVRFHKDGNIEYITRIDNQVKIRGFRIELGEIEVALSSFPGILKTVVIPKIGAMGDARLVAYFVTDGKSFFSVSELQSHLGRQLPGYMIPQHFMQLEAFPLTPVGKIDRKALPDIENVHGQDEYIAPVTDTENVLSEIWQTVLGIRQISIQDNFFNIGGHSLLAIQVVAKIKKLLNVPLSLRNFFENPTIHSLAELIDSTTSTTDVISNLSIPKRTTANAPLSFQQQRLWYLNKLNPGATVFNVPAGWRIKGPLDANLFEHCLNRVFERHEILRTAIKDFDDGPRQVTLPSVQFHFNRVDLSQEQEEKKEEKFYSLIRIDAKSIFDLSEAPLFKATLYKFSDHEHVFSYMPHHVIWDGWSFDIFRHELKMLYESALAGQTARLPDLPIQYADFSEWQRNRVNSPEYKAHIDYWKQQLAGRLPILQLPTDHPRPAILTYDNGGSEPFSLSRQMTDGLTEIARGSEATLFMLLLAAFNILLHRYTNDNDIIVGTPISGRDQEEIANLIGFFVNTLVIKTKINADAPFDVFLKQVRELCIDAFNHQEVPFEQLVEILNPARDLSRSPLFQVLFIYQDARNRKNTIADLSLAYIDAPTPGTQTDIDFWVRLTDNGIAGGFRYNSDLFEPETIKQMLGNYQMILEGILNASQAPVKDINILPAEDYQKIVYEWNNTDCLFHGPSTVHQLFEKQTTLTPEATAIVFNEKSVTYRELNQKSNQWAHKLIESGVKEKSFVGIYLERSLEMVTCMLGVLKAGAAYLPLDPDYPQERIAFMAEDADLSIIVSQKHLSEGLPAYVQKVLFVEESGITRYHSENPDAKISPEDLAYIIYTSGSTGKPKGVQVPHQALTNFLLSMQKKPGIRSNDILLAVTTFSFDIAALELFLPLISGATCVITDRETAMDGQQLVRQIACSETTIMQATPSTWRLLIAAGWEGKENLKILCGGEAFPQDLVRPLLNRCSELWNMYGPTETTIWSTCMQITDAEKPMSIGRPIANTQVYILDPDMNPVPIGVLGELYIGGTGVTKGYLNRQQLTENQFIANPFIETGADQKQALMYRTGDRGRYLPDGTIEYLERIDTQIKVRGFRIELGEIEASLSSHEEVAQAVVVCREERPGDKRIYAYIMPRIPGNLDPAALKKHMRSTLPEYMVPQHFVEINTIPLTPAGKVDRKALPSLDSEDISGKNEFIAPATDTEKKLAQIWQNVISISQISIHDNFFDIGGHSLLAVEVFADIKRKFHLELPLAILFQAPTIQDLANCIDAELYVAGSGSSDLAVTAEREEFEF